MATLGEDAKKDKYNEPDDAFSRDLTDATAQLLKNATITGRTELSWSALVTKAS